MRHDDGGLGAWFQYPEELVDEVTATNGIEVTAGNELTINAPFTGLSATTQLDKNDNGTLILNAANSGWSGSITALWADGGAG